MSNCRFTRHLARSIISMASSKLARFGFAKSLLLWFFFAKLSPKKPFFVSSILQIYLPKNLREYR